MTDRRCPGCDQPITDGALCWHRAARIRSHLTDLPDLVVELHTQLARQSVTGGRASSSRSATKPLPFDPRAAVLLDDVADLLRTWNARITSTPPIPSAIAYLGARHLADKLAAHPWHTRDDAPELLTALDDLAHKIRRAIDTPPQRRYLGPCAAVDLEGHECAGDVYQLGNKPPTCATCHATHAADERLAWIADLASDMLVTAHTAAGALSAWGEHIKPDLIRSWASRGRLAVKGHDRHGHPLYAFADCRTLAADTITRRKDRA